MKKMKQIFKTSGITFMLLTLIAVFAVSCEDEDKDRFAIFADGGFVRFADPFPTAVNISSLDELPTVTIPVTLETPDGNVVSYSMEVSAMVGGQEYGPVPFGSEVTSFPADVTLGFSDLVAALGIDIDDVGFGDTFNFIGTAVNDQGVVYTGERLAFDEETQTRSGGNNSDDLLDETGYRNAFDFGFAIPCPPINNPTAGTWIIDMQDSYGDGWNSAFLTVEIDGATSDYDVPAGNANTETFDVPAGTSILRISFTSGSWDSEITFTFEDPNGTVYGPFGPNPTMCPELGI